MNSEQIKIPFMRSLNPTPEQIKKIELVSEYRDFLRRAKASLRQFGVKYEEITFQDFLKLRKSDAINELDKQCSRLEYYKKFAKFNNHKKLN